MRERGWDRIVTVVSDTVWSPPSPQLLAYVTSKSALIGMTRVLALGADRITVNAVAPGADQDAGGRSRRPGADVRRGPCPAGTPAQPDTG